MKKANKQVSSRSNQTVKRSNMFSIRSRLRGSLQLSNLKFLFVALVVAVLGSRLLLFSHAATGDGSVPVYVVARADLHNHFLTTSSTDAKAFVSAWQYSDEGTAFYAWADGANGRIPIYRLFNPTTFQHFYVPNQAQVTFFGAYGWKLDATAFYAYDAPAAGRLPVYRLHHPNSDHKYVTTQAENDALVKAGWVTEGISFYVSDQTPIKNVNAPQAIVDTDTCQTISGWAYDPDIPTMSTQVHIYIDGEGVPIVANQPRPDINKVLNITGNHGFSYTVPAKWRDDKVHNIDVYAINYASDGNSSGNNLTIGKRAQWICSGNTDKTPQLAAFYNAVTIATAADCLAPGGTSTVKCSQAEHDQQAAYFSAMATAAVCVADSSGATKRCSQAEHDQQAAYFSAASRIKNNYGGGGGVSGGGGGGGGVCITAECMAFYQAVALQQWASGGGSSMGGATDIPGLQLRNSPQPVTSNWNTQLWVTPCPSVYVCK